MKRFAFILCVLAAAFMLTGCDELGDGYPDRVAGETTCTEGDYQLYEATVYGREDAADVAFDCEAALRAGIGSTQYDDGDTNYPDDLDTQGAE